MNKTDEVNVNFENKKNQKKKIALILMVVVLLIGVTYAYFRIRKYTEEFTGNIGGFKITYETSSEIKVTEAYPIRYYEVEDQAYSNAFKIENTGEKDVYVKLSITDVVLSEQFKKKPEDLKWGLYEETIKDEVTTSTKVASGNFEYYENQDIIILPEISLKAATETTTESKNYNLRIWIAETYKEQNQFEKGTLSGKITATVQGKTGDYLASKIYSANAITNPAFTKEAKNSSLFELKDDITKTNFGFPIRYYKGGVTNNYVQFGTYKEKVINNVYDKSSTEETAGEDTGTTTLTATQKDVAEANSPIIWRILRVNEDRSVTLIAQNDIGTNIAWNGNGVSYKDSSIKTALDDWYKKTFTETYLDSKVMTTSFCNDKSSDYRLPAARLNKTTAIPSLKCSEEDLVKAKVGLPTADDLVYAGAIYNNAMTTPSYTTYLDNKTNFWTMTPFSSTDLFIWKSDSSYMSNITSSTSDTAAARPVITIKPDVTVVSGNGNESTPYVLSVE